MSVKTTALERAQLGRDIDARVADVNVRLDTLSTLTDAERTTELDAIRADLTQLDEDISYLQRITRESRSWG